MYEIMTVMPLLAIASSLGLLASVLVVFSSHEVPRATGFSVHERRKMQTTLAARTPLLTLPPSDTSRRAVDMRV